MHQFCHIPFPWFPIILHGKSFLDPAKFNPFSFPVQKKSCSKQGTMAVKGSVAVGINPRCRPVQTADGLGNIAARGHSQGLAREEATRKETAGEEASLGSAFPTTLLWMRCSHQALTTRDGVEPVLAISFHPMPKRCFIPRTSWPASTFNVGSYSCWGKKIKG